MKLARTIHANEIVDIVLNNFTDLKLRDHVYIVAQNMATSPLNPSNSFVEEADAVLEGQSNMDDIFDILFECAKKHSPGIALLDTGLQTKSHCWLFWQLALMTARYCLIA